MTARRRRSPWRALVIFLVVIVVLVVAVDRIGQVLADREIASRIQTSEGLPSKPTVKIEGFPFLTQVISNRYQAITMRATGVPIGDSGDQTTASEIDARLTGVRTADHFSSVTAKTVRGSAVIGFAELSRMTGIDLSYAGGTPDGNGRLQAKRTVTFLGKSITGVVSAEATSNGDVLNFSSVKVGLTDAALSLPQALADQFTSVFQKQLSLAGLPFGLQIDRLQSSSAGVTIVASGTNVTFK